LKKAILNRKNALFYKTLNGVINNFFKAQAPNPSSSPIFSTTTILPFCR